MPLFTVNTAPPRTLKSAASRTVAPAAKPAASGLMGGLDQKLKESLSNYRKFVEVEEDSDDDDEDWQ